MSHKQNAKTAISYNELKKEEAEVNFTNDIFAGFIIFLLPTGMGSARCGLFRRHILKGGGKVVDQLIPGVTHIVVDENMTIERLIKVQSIKACSELSSHYIVKSMWLSQCLKERKRICEDNFCLKVSKTQFSNEKTSEASCIPSSTSISNHSLEQDGSGPPKHADYGSDYVASDRDDSEDEQPCKKRKITVTSWACAQATSDAHKNYNKHITEKLEAMASLYTSTNDKWRALGYQKAISAIKRHPKAITSFEEAKCVPGVGMRLAEKIWEIVESGGLQKLDELEQQEDVQSLQLFTKVWGVGHHTAQLWVQAGYRTLQQVRQHAQLNKQQVIGLKYFDDLLERMPREEAAEIEATVNEAACAIIPGLICMACGSYRRGRSSCGDVDILITHPDGKSHKGLFAKLLESLKKTGFLTDDLVTSEDNGNQKKYLGVCVLPGEGRKHRRLDIIVVPYDEFACALVYFTGSAHLNRSMRHLAGKLGMSLNEHALCTGVVRKGGVKISPGQPTRTPTEQSIFEALGLQYRPPEERDI